MNDGQASMNGPLPDDAIVLERVTKRFGEVTAVDDVSLAIRAGEFFSMLGPSGCGKTTTLRMIAGFETPDRGRVLLRGKDVTVAAPQKRNVNMVFQSYGLFPHMTVAENISFGPRIKKLGRAEIEARTSEILKTVRLEGMAERRPAQLSGGQQQRVALARALVNRPAALLLDEPLGALDLKLRKEMQLELKDLQTRTGTTFVYVTHDQEEAMTMSDRIAVMNGGVVEQLASPRDLYQRPASAFVAGFIGTSNLITLRFDRRAGGLVVMDLGDGQRILAPDPGAEVVEALITVRPEWIKRSSGAAGDRTSVVSGTIVDVVYLGSLTQLIVDLPTGDRLSVHQLNDEVDAAEPRRGERVLLQWAPEHSYVIGSKSNLPEPVASAEEPSVGSQPQGKGGRP
jgi:spermidine/putrescine transport system ATP-binding protein